MIVFFVMPLLGMAYVGWHVWTLLPFGAWPKAIVIAVGVACVLLLFLDIAGKLDHLPMPVAQVLYEIGTSSIIVLLYAVMLFLVVDILRLVRVLPAAWVTHSGYGSGVVFFLLVAVFLYGYFNYMHKERVALTLETSKPLPHDYKVVMLSDLHLGYHNPRKELARWVDMVNAEKPDFVLIAGDIIDVSVRPLLEENAAEEFRRIKAPVYACLGNHEYYSGSPEARKFYEDAGIRLLSDTNAVIDDAITIIGRDDRTNTRRKPLAHLMQVVNKDNYTIVLDHQPYHLDQAERSGVDFQLSGHTHRGQVWPMSWVTDKMYECSWGSHQRGNTRYYVSSGIGIWGGKFRIGTQSEYVVATLRSKQ